MDSQPATGRDYGSPHIVGFSFLTTNLPTTTDQQSGDLLSDHRHGHNHSDPQFTDWDSLRLYGAISSEVVNLMMSTCK